MKDVCTKCAHYRTCRKPCAPVQQYLMEGNRSVFQQTATNERGETITIVYSESNRVKRESELTHDINGENVKLSEVVSACSTGNDLDVFRDRKPKLKMTGIFYDRFFKGLSYGDLAVKYDISVEMARSHFNKAIKKIDRILDALDSPEMKSMEFARQKVHGVGTIPKAQKYFLLNRLFGLIPSEIASMEGLKSPEAVRKLIIRVSDKYATGEIQLIEIEQGDQEQARQRLDAKRVYHRKLHQGKKKRIGRICVE